LQEGIDKDVSTWMSVREIMEDVQRTLGASIQTGPFTVGSVRRDFMEIKPSAVTIDRGFVLMDLSVMTILSAFDYPDLITMFAG